MLCRLLLKDEKGLLSKESARSVIDGSVFQKLAEEREKRLQRRRVDIYKHTSAAVHCEQQHTHVCITPSIDPGIDATECGCLHCQSPAAQQHLRCVAMQDEVRRSYQKQR